MSRMIIKLTDSQQDWYLEWSTVVDAPITYGMSLEEFKAYYKEEYGRSSMDELEKQLERVEEIGTSSRIHDSVDDLIAFNRAGDNESQISKEELIQKFCYPVEPTINDSEDYVAECKAQ